MMLKDKKLGKVLVAVEISKISETTKEQSVNMEGNAAVAKTNAQNLERLAGTSEEIVAQAETLNQVVNQFKINNNIT